MWLWSGICLAAETVNPSRTLEGLPPLAWKLLLGCAFIGWIVGHLKNFVVSMNRQGSKAVAGAEAMAIFVASHSVGVALGVWLLTEATYKGQPVGALYAYIAAGIGAYGGKKGFELGWNMTVRAWRGAWNLPTPPT